MYLINENGSSLFELSYPKDFLLHCAYELQERTNERLFLLDFPLVEVNRISLSACDGFNEFTVGFTFGGEGSPKIVMFKFCI